VSDDSEEKGYESVAAFFARPSGWFTNQLREYHKDPDRFLGALCSAVATRVLLDSTRGDEVKEEVIKELANRSS
jgi:hypothetical protein